MPEPDLFAASPVDALTAFDEWISRSKTSRGLNGSSLAVQRAMWTAFAGWCIRQRIDPVSLTANGLAAYLRSREGTAAASELTARYAWRLVRLIGQVVGFMADEQGAGANTAAS